MCVNVQISLSTTGIHGPLTANWFSQSTKAERSPEADIVACYRVEIKPCTASASLPALGSERM